MKEKITDSVTTTSIHDGYIWTPRQMKLIHIQKAVMSQRLVLLNIWRHISTTSLFEAEILFLFMRYNQFWYVDYIRKITGKWELASHKAYGSFNELLNND